MQPSLEKLVVLWSVHIQKTETIFNDYLNRRRARRGKHAPQSRALATARRGPKQRPGHVGGVSCLSARQRQNHPIRLQKRSSVHLLHRGARHTRNVHGPHEGARRVTEQGFALTHRAQHVSRSVGHRGHRKPHPSHLASHLASHQASHLASHLVQPPGQRVIPLPSDDHHGLHRRSVTTQSLQDTAQKVRPPQGQQRLGPPHATRETRRRDQRPNLGGLRHRRLSPRFAPCARPPARQ